MIRWIKAHRCCSAGIGLGLLATALMLPTLIGPTPLNDSHAINLVWGDQFTAALRGGEIWPRWLPASHDGLGAPVFYFYGPVAFWIVGLFGLTGLPLWPAIAATGLLALIASGLAMIALLRDEAAPRAWIGAAIFVASPYHVLDLLRRGALAEFLAIAWLPLVALGMRRASLFRLWPLALPYAGLVATHLPTALLASVFLFPFLVIERTGLARAKLIPIGAGFALGIGLAAAYCLPALALQHYVNMDAMHGSALMQPANWRPASYWSGANPALLMLLAVIVALAVPAACLRGRQGWFALAMLVLAVGIAWPLWLVPPLPRVQFPWRILSLAEFGIALAIGHSRIDGAKLLLALAPAMMMTLAVLTPSILMIGEPQPKRQIAGLLRHHPDVDEYRPHGITAPIHAPLWETRTDAGVTTIRRFAFPAWIARCAAGDVATRASTAGLIQYRGDGCKLVRVATVPERIGAALSLASLLILAMLTLPSRQRRGILSSRPWYRHDHHLA